MKTTKTIATFKGQTVTVGETVKGWIAVTFPDGTIGKAREKDLHGTRTITEIITCDAQGNEVVEVEGERKNGCIKAQYLANYTTIKLDDGSIVRDNGDDAAVMLRGLDTHEIYVVGSKKLGTTVAALREKYGHLNAGMIKMNIANRIRKALRDADAAE